jgi:hypothetical protein
MLMDDDHLGLRVTPGAGLQLVDRGDLQVKNGYLEATVDLIEKQVSEIHGHTLAIGGDHTISLPLLRALRKPTASRFRSCTSTPTSTPGTTTSGARWGTARPSITRSRRA